MVKGGERKVTGAATQTTTGKSNGKVEKGGKIMEGRK